MKKNSLLFILSSGLIIAVAMAVHSTRSAAAQCFNQQQTEVPCPATEPAKTKHVNPTRVPATATLTATPTDTPTSTATETPQPTFTDTATPTEIVTPPVAPALAQSEPPPPAPSPGLNPAHFPPVVFVGVGVWILVLIVLIGGWLVGGGAPNPNAPNLPQRDGRKTRIPPRRVWGGGTLLWILVGAAVFSFRQQIPVWLGELCVPDLALTDLSVTKGDHILVTIANDGLCDTPASTVKRYRDDSLALVKKKAPFPLEPPYKVPALKSGETQTLDLGYSYHAYDAYEVWGYTYMGAMVNPDRKMTETDYYNDFLAIKLPGAP